MALDFLAGEILGSGWLESSRKVIGTSIEGRTVGHFLWSLTCRLDKEMAVHKVSILDRQYEQTDLSSFWR